MLKQVPAALLLVVGFFVMAGPASAETLTIFTHNTKGQAEVRDGQLRGLPQAGLRAVYLEIVREILADLGTPDIRIRDVPFKRGYEFAANRENTLLFNIARTEEREALFKWIGPTWLVQDFIYAAASNTDLPARMEEALDQKICVVRGNIHDSYFSKLAPRTVSRANTYETCFKRLHEGQADLTVIASVDLVTTLAKANLSPDQFVNTGIKVSEHGGYIAASLDLADDTVARWQAALDAMKADGRHAEIVRTFAHPSMNLE
ncbi:MAG: substrate-binding periplasmic protein [Magnetovibrionaceae bacterium]